MLRPYIVDAKPKSKCELKQNFGIQIVQDATFFPEWLDGLEALKEEDQHLLDRVKANFLELMDDPPMLENTVNPHFSQTMRSQSI
jgi:hypothetical protein